MSTTKSLNQFLSNLAVLTFKLHNLHWNVVGVNFAQVHEFTEKLYDDAFKKFDEVAEILKMRGETPLVKLSDYLANATIKEVDAKAFSVSEVIGTVKADIGTLVKEAEAVRAAAVKDDDYKVFTVFEEYLKGYAKTLWFLSAMTK